MSVYGAQTAEESVEAFLAEIDDDAVRDAVDDAFVFQRPVHLRDAEYAIDAGPKRI